MRVQEKKKRKSKNKQNESRMSSGGDSELGVCYRRRLLSKIFTFRRTRYYRPDRYDKTVLSSNDNPSAQAVVNLADYTSAVDYRTGSESVSPRQKYRRQVRASPVMAGPSENRGEKGAKVQTGNKNLSHPLILDRPSNNFGVPCKDNAESWTYCATSDD